MTFEEALERFTFEEALERFIEKSQAMIDDHFREHLKPLVSDKLSLMPGRKYIRVVQTTDGAGRAGQRSVWCFVNKENGDILKAATWKAPAKHARGSIYNEDPIKDFTSHGPPYLI